MLDRASPLPLWAQIVEDLRRRLVGGEFENRFPTDEELTRDYEVSRQTVREGELCLPRRPPAPPRSLLAPHVQGRRQDRQPQAQPATGRYL